MFWVVLVSYDYSFSNFVHIQSYKDNKNIEITQSVREKFLIKGSEYNAQQKEIKTIRAVGQLRWSRTTLILDLVMVLMVLMVPMVIKKYHRWAVLDVRPTGGIFCKGTQSTPYHKKLPVEGLCLEGNTLAIGCNKYNTGLLTCDVTNNIDKA